MTDLVDFLRRLEKLARPGLVVSRNAGPPLLLAAARQAVPDLAPSIIDAAAGRKALTRSMQTPVFGILICRGELHADLLPTLEHLLRDEAVLDDQQGQWQPVHAHEKWRLVAVADTADFPLADRFAYKLNV